LFKIDKSSVEYMGSNMSIFVVLDEYQDDQVEEDGAEGRNDPSLLTADMSRRVRQDAERQAQEVLRQAERQAQECLQEARHQAEALRKTAWQQGFDEGTEEARRDFAALKKRESELREAISRRLEEFEQSICNELEEAILQLSLDIAEKIVNKELERDDTVFVDIVKAAVMRISGERKVALRVSADDYDRFFEDGGQGLREETQCAELLLIRDEFMEPGSCLFESERGIMDASISSQLSVIAQALNQGRKAI